MADYKRYLAASILTEDKVVTYRVLSRALKVNVNAAKEMLYEFHRQQNAKKPGTIQATYLLSGTKQEPDPITIVKKDGEDEHMQSSPFMSSMPQPEDTGSSSVLTITLVREEDLETVKESYEVITSIQVYSLAPHPLKEIQLLSDSTRELLTLTATEDPLETLSTYGIITNPLCKRRPNRRPPTITAARSVPAPAVKKPEPAATAKEEPKPSKTEGKAVQSQAAKDFFAKGKEKERRPGSGNSSKEGTPAPPANLKRENSSLFKSFAKAKPKKLASEDASIQGMAMDADDDDEEEEEYIAPAPKKTRVSKGDEEEVEPEESRKSRKAREEELRQMMEDSDDDILPAKEVEPEEEEVEVKPEPAKEEEPIVVVSGGRRRGKRRVMKKKTVKDDEGYLVTKEEAVWESFSEDEPVSKPKPKASAPTTAKGKKAAEKKGQGNIMSFFGKKT